MILVHLLLGLILFKLGWAADCPEKEIVCYYSTWAYYREGYGHFAPEHVDPNLCTRVVYTFAGLDLNGKITTLDSQFDIVIGGFYLVNSLKEKNPCLKTSLAIGGWNEGSRKYSVMASTPETQDAFVESVINFIVYYGFDGFDFDWEYPTQRGGITNDKENFNQLLQKLKTRFDPWGLTLSVAVPISSEVTQQAFDMAALGQTVDYVYLMAYDFTSTTSPVTGLISPFTSIQKVVDEWLTYIPSQKLLLGLPSYARTYNLLDPAINGIDAPTNGTGVAGEFTKEKGFLSYYELQAKLLTMRYTKVDVPEEYNSYAYRKGTTEWMTFDTLESYEYKVDYAISKNLGGVMIWTIDTDDFVGNYSNMVPYPIISQVYNKLIEQST